MKKILSSNHNKTLKGLTNPIKANFENYSDVDYLPGFKEWDNLIDQDEFKRLDAELFPDELEDRISKRKNPKLVANNK